MAPVHYIRKPDDLPNFRPRCPEPGCPGFVATKLCRGSNNKAHKGLWYDVCHTSPESHFLGFRNDIPRGYQPASYNKTSDSTTETPRKSHSYSYDGRRRQNGAVPQGKVPPEDRPISLRSASPTLETFDPDLEPDVLLNYDLDPDLFLIPDDSNDSTLPSTPLAGLSLLPDAGDEPMWLNDNSILFTVSESAEVPLATPPSSPDAPLSVSMSVSTRVPPSQSSNAPDAALPAKSAARAATRTPSKAGASKRSKTHPPVPSEEEPEQPVGALSQPFYDMIPAHIHSRSQAVAASKPLSRQAERQSREREAKETVQFWFWRESSKKPRRFDIHCPHWPLFRILDCSKTVRLALLPEADHEDPTALIEMYDPSEETWLTIEIASCRSVEPGVPLLFRTYGLEDGVDMSEKEQSCRAGRNPTYSRQGKRPYTATVPDPATPSRSVRPRVRSPSPVSPIQTPTPPSRVRRPAPRIPGTPPPAPLAALQVGDALVLEDGFEEPQSDLVPQNEVPAMPTAEPAATLDSLAPDGDVPPSTPAEGSYARATIDPSLRLVPARPNSKAKWPLKYVCFMAQGFEAMGQLSGTQEQNFCAAFPGSKYVRTTLWEHEKAWKDASESQRQRYVDAGTSGGLTWPQFCKEVKASRRS
ncbi:hypothetical protein FA95DRAFT_1601600 [Auriscalpium vulgare]|uniref:Uncharacterized protein n=1 Tax=Auriscalpium vulgare TaxID=40419 RepID=A0ACB8S8N7_9AGAM|nr:hypothetical protein FA95DRAFT_1601600 [Auriscalpium vulgare]